MMSTLALLGGSPVIDDTQPHFAWPPLSDTTLQKVTEQLRTTISIYDRSGIIADLEDALATYHGTRRALLTSSGTAALHSAYAACGIGPRDEVIVPAYTFLATATPLLHLGATPVLVDSDAGGNLDPDQARKAITERTRAIVVTHMWGYPADVLTLRDIADFHQLRLIEDCSHAHGASTNGRKVGTFGHIAAFSMNGPKPLSAGEGGFILTNEDELYHQALLHGHYNKRCRNELPTDHPHYRYATTGMGLKYRIHPLAAAIAHEQLTHLDSYLEGRAKIANHMINRLGSMPGITVRTPLPGQRAAWYGLTMTYDSEQTGGVPIETFYHALRAEGCQEVDRPGSTCPLNLHPLFQDPLPLLPTYPGALTNKAGQFPVCEELHRNTIKLPVWHRDDDLPIVDGYLDAFSKVISHYHDLARVNL